MPSRQHSRRGRFLRRALLALTVLAVAFVIIGSFRPQWHLRAYLRLQAAMAGASASQIDVRGVRWVYLHAGDDHTRLPPILLVHGFTGSKENWLPVFSTLSDSRRVIAPDLSGWGDSQRLPDTDPAGNYGYAAQAERLAAFITALGVGPVDLVAHSMGGGIAAVLAARHPEQVSRLVLMDAAGVRYQDNAFGQAVLDGDNPFAVTDNASLHRYLATVFKHPPFVPWPINRALIARRIADADFEQRVLDQIARGSEAFLPGQLAGDITADTLLMWCRDDQVVDPSSVGLWGARLPRSQSAWIDDCNHMPMMEQPAETSARLLKFLGTRIATASKPANGP